MAQTIQLEDGQRVEVSDEIANSTPEEVRAAMAQMAKEADDSVVRNDYDVPNYNTLMPGEIAGELQAVEDGDRDYLPASKAAELNDKFDIDAFYGAQVDDTYNKYLAGREEAFAKYQADPSAENGAKVNEWDDYYTSTKDTNETYANFYGCTTGGECDEENRDYYNLNKNRAVDWKYEDQKYNQDLTKSLRRTYGNYSRFGKSAGKLFSDEKLVSMMMTDQVYMAENMANLGIEAATMDNLTDQQKKDLAFQMMVYDKIQATEEGSRDATTQTAQVVAAFVTDPINYGVAASFLGGPQTGAAAIAAKQSAKVLTRKKMKDYLSDFVSSQVTKATAKSALIGAGWVGGYDLSKQSIKIQADVQDNVEWGEFTQSVALGATFGGSLGLLIGGGSKIFNSLATKYMIKNKIGDREFLKQIRDNVTDEKSLYTWLKNIGWTKKEAKEELAYLQKEGFEYDGATKSWKSETQEYKPSLNEKLSEEANLGKDVNKHIVSKETVSRGEKALDEEYIDVSRLDLPIPFSRAGQNLFNWVNRLGTTIGPKVARTMYGSDSILVRSGLRREATAINDAMAATDINVARMSHDLRDLSEKNAEQLGDINKLIRDRNPINKEQNTFLKKLDGLKDNQMRMAYKNKLITADEYQAFLKDKSYIPRVWNSQHLLTDKGAAEFSEFMTKLWSKDPRAARAIIKNITGEKDVNKMTDEIINSRFAPGRIKNMFRNKSDREIDVHRSSHLEHQRKLEVAPKYEHMLDQFMAAPVDRWSKFFEDVVKRNEFARRFGAKDQYIHKRIKQLEKEKKGLEADHLREAYFTTMGDARNSRTVKAKMDNPVFMKGVAKINAFQNLKLGLAAIPNATQAFVNGTTKLVKSQGLIKAPFKAISALVRATVRTKRGMDIVHRAGVLGETDLGRIATENMPHARLFENEFKGPLKYLNEPTKFLRAVGFLGVEEMNRRAAAIMAHGHIADLHAQLLKLTKKGKRTSKRAGSIEREMKKLGVHNPHKPELSARDYAVSGHMFNKQVNFSGESFNIPTTWQGPYGKLFTKFKSFMFYQARFLKREVTDELFIHKNPKPLLAYLATAGIAGNAAEQLRALATGKEIEENRNALELLISGIGNAGGSGLWWDTMKQVGERGPGAAWGAVLGPTASDVAYTIQDIGNADINNIIKRLLPNIPGKHQLMDSLKY